MKKRLLAVLLSVVMLFSCLPFSAFALGESTGTGDTATYALNVPEVGTYTVGDIELDVISKDGENFWVYDADAFGGKTLSSTLETGTIGVSASAVSGAKYFAIRIKIDDENAAYYWQNSRFSVYVRLNGVDYRIDTYQKHSTDIAFNEDGTEDSSTTTTNVVTKRRAAANYFVDLKDASLSKFFATGGVAVNSAGIETTGTVDGIMLFPLSNNEALTEAALAADYEGVTIVFQDEEGVGSSKQSNWDNKTVYIGDMYFVDDYDAFYEAKVDGKTKYSLNNGGSSINFTKVGPFRSYYRHYGTNTKVGTGYSDYGATDSNVHITTLPNGDRAAAVTYTSDTSVVPYYTLDELNAGTTAVNAPYVSYLMDSYRDNFDPTNSQYDQKGAPIDANGNYEIAIEDAQYIAVRMAIAGGNEDAWVMWAVSNVNIDGTGYSITNGTALPFIDINTGEVSSFTHTSSRVTTTGSFDGYVLVPISALTTSNGDKFDSTKFYENVRFIQFSLTRGFYDGKTLYVGDSYFVEDMDKFQKSVYPPEIEYTATNDSITVSNAPTDGSVEYSFNGGDFSTTATFTGLTNDTKYTISARYTGYTGIRTIDAWTSPYSTHLGDTASYFMNVYDEPTIMTGSNNGNGVNSPIHYASNDFARNSSGVYGNNQRIYVVELDGETFIEFDMDEAKLTGNKQIRVYYNAFEDLSKTSQLGVSDLIDTTNITALAYRIRVSGGEEGTVSKLNICFGNGLFALTNLIDGGAYLIDYATRKVVDPTEENVVTFDGEFDGWFVVPFECITNSSGTDNSVKDIILGDVEGASLDAKTGVRDIQFIFQHDGTTTDWTNRNLYVGDVLTVENTKTFNSVRLSCDVIGHSYKSVVTAPTCTKDGYTTHTCTVCGDSYKDSVVAAGHSYDNGVVTAPTQSSEGYTTYTCTACGDSYTANYTSPLKAYDGNLSLGIYHIPSGADNYLTDGVNTDADKLREFEDVLKQGYNNCVIISTIDDALFVERIELCKKYNITFWLSTRLYEADKQSMSFYLSHQEYFVEIIKELDAWNLFLGFHWDEPLYNGCTNSDLYEMTKALYLKWGKRTFPVFGLQETVDNFYGTATREITLLESWATEYITDCGWDWYSMDPRESAQSNTSLQKYIANWNATWGSTATTADELYRYVHQNLVNKFEHDFNVWFFPAAIAYKGATGVIDEAQAQGHLEYFANLLSEQEYQGGLFVYGYETYSDRTGLHERLPVLNSDGEQELCPDTDKWYDYAEDLQALKTKYDNTFVSRVNGVDETHFNVTDVYHDSIVYDAAAGFEYSIDGGSTWETDGVFSSLTAETEYTITVKDTIRDVTSTHSVTTTSTTPYASGNGDTGSYIIKMPSDSPVYSYFHGHISTSIARTLDDSAFANASGYLPLKDIDGERYIEIRNNNAEGSFIITPTFGDANRSKFDMGISDRIDTSKLTAFALRIKTTGGTDDQLSVLSFSLNSTEPSDVLSLPLVDAETGDVSYVEYNNGLKITGNIDGWLIIPFDAWADIDQLSSTTNKDWIAKYFNGFYFTTHEGECGHVGSSSWDNDKRLYLGDLLCIEDQTAFSNARKEAVLPTASATCANGISVTVVDGQEYSIDGVTWNTTGVFSGLTASTTYTVYTRIAGTTKNVSAEITTGTSHTYLSKTIAPTCTEQGYTLMTCKVCATTRQTKYVDALGHSYDDGVVTAPTCTADGYTTYTCSTCGDSYTDNVVAASHSYDDGVVTAPTCTTEGYTTYTCTVCGDSYTGNTTATVDHSYDSGVVTAPTTTTQGYTTYTCTVCGYSYKSNFTPATGDATNAYNVVATPSDTNIVVTWDAVANATRYQFYLKNSAGETLITKALDATATSITLNWGVEIEWGETYSIGIRPKTSSWLDTVYVESALELGNRIVDIKTESVGRTIEVTWQAYEGATQYYVYVYEKGAYPTSFSAIKATTNKVTIINAIYAEVDYEVRVVATKGVDKMYTADAISVPARLNVFSPDVFIERGTTPTAVAVAWDTIRGVDKCWVYLNRVDGTGTEIIRETTGAIVGLYNLTPNTEYTVQIQARIMDADGVAHYSGKSEVLGTISTTDWEDIGFSAAGTDAGAELSWTVPTNALRYYIYRSTNGGKSFSKISTIEDGTVSSYTDANAKNGYVYAIVYQLKDDFVAAKSSMIKSAAIVK